MIIERIPISTNLDTHPEQHTDETSNIQEDADNTKSNGTTSNRTISAITNDTPDTMTQNTTYTTSPTTPSDPDSPMNKSNKSASTYEFTPPAPNINKDTNYPSQATESKRTHDDITATPDKQTKTTDVLKRRPLRSPPLKQNTTTTEKSHQNYKKTDMTIPKKLFTDDNVNDTTMSDTIETTKTNTTTTPIASVLTKPSK